MTIGVTIRGNEFKRRANSLNDLRGHAHVHSATNYLWPDALLNSIRLKGRVFVCLSSQTFNTSCNQLHLQVAGERSLISRSVIHFPDNSQPRAHETCCLTCQELDITVPSVKITDWIQNGTQNGNGNLHYFGHRGPTVTVQRK